MRRGIHQGSSALVVWLSVLACALIGMPEARAAATDDDKIILALERDQDNMDPAHALPAGRHHHERQYV